MRFCPLRWLMAKVDRRQKARSVTIPAPVGGLNTRDALAAMEPLYASHMFNWFPTPTHVELRKGFEIAQTTTAPSSFNGNSFVFKYADTSLFMTGWDSGTNVYNVENVATGALALTFTRANMTEPPSYAQFTKAAGSFLIVVFRDPSYTNNHYTYDGAAWTNRTGTIGGPNVWGVATYKNRLWFTSRTTGAQLSAWYLPTSAITGSLVEFPLGGIASKGGTLNYIASWTRDGGIGGSDDLIVFVTSEGQAIVYQGDDPSSAATFGLVGIFDLSRSLGRPIKYGADLLLPMEDGLYSMTQILSGRIGPEYAISDTVRQKWQEYAAHAISNASANTKPDRMMLAYSARLNQLVAFFPGKTSSTYIGTQSSSVLAMNTISKAWTEYGGFMTGYSIEEFGGYLYFTSYRGTALANYAAHCYKFGAVTTDTIFAGTTFGIQAECRQAYNYLGAPGNNKQLTAIKSSFTTTGTNLVAFAADKDFVATLGFGLTVPTTTSFAAGSYTAIFHYPVYGGAIAPFAFVDNSTNTSAATLSWYATTLLFEVGGFAN